MRKQRPNMGYIVDQVVDEVMEEMRQVLDRKSYNLNSSLLREAIQTGVCRGIEEGLNLSTDFMPERFCPGFSIRRKEKDEKKEEE